VGRDLGIEHAVTAQVWMRHPDTGGEALVPETAVPILRQSGWDLLSDDEVTAKEQAAIDEAAAAEQAMAAQAQVAADEQVAAEQEQAAEFDTAPALAPVESATETAPRPASRKKENG
jgi:hypothetical protein